MALPERLDALYRLKAIQIYNAMGKRKIAMPCRLVDLLERKASAPYLREASQSAPGAFP